MSDQANLVPGWADEHGITFPILLGADTNQVVSDYRLVSTPLNLILNSEGRIIHRLDGYGPGAEERLRSQVLTALDEAGVAVSG